MTSLCPTDLLSNALCNKVHESHRAVARRHPHIKCVRIVATEAVPNYPAANVPTLLLYHRSDPVDQLVGPRALASVTPERALSAFRLTSRRLSDTCRFCSDRAFPVAEACAERRSKEEGL